MPTVKRYDSLTVTLHWLVAVLVIGQWIGAQLIDEFPKGAPRVDARSIHIVGGVLVGLLLLVRIVWRATSGRRLPASDQGLLHAAAKLTHWGLYVLIAAMVAVGLALAWARGDSLFNLVTIPSFAPGDKAFRDQIQDIHATIGYLILGLAGLHAAAALVHHFIWKDGLIRRMSWNG